MHFESELKLARNAFVKGHLQVSWRHLERAHTLGQSWPVQYTKAHWYMIAFALRIKNGKEIAGQFPRLMIGGIKSFIGKIHVGNTGGANVPALRLMEIPADLRHILDQFKNKS